MLVATADAIRATVRATDLVGRWGGDEFIVLGMGHIEQADALSDRIRQQRPQRRGRPGPVGGRDQRGGRHRVSPGRRRRGPHPERGRRHVRPQAPSPGWWSPHRLDSGGDPARRNPRPARRSGTRSGATARSRRRDPQLPRREGVGHGRAPRAQPGRRRADHRPPPGVPVAGRHDHLGHRPPGLRPQDPHGPCARLRPAAAARRPVGLSEPHRERPRPRRELARVHGPVLRRRAGEGLGAARAARPASRGRGDRRRSPDRRHGLGGAQQHRGLRPPARHRRQRQRALLLADDRRAGPPPVDPAHDARVRAVHELGQEGPAPDTGGRRADLRRPARHEEGRQGRRGPAGTVRGPRA